MADFERDLKGNLYKVWNRMSSGSYFILPTFTLSDTMGNAVVQEVTWSHAESGPLVGANCFERPQSIRPLEDGNATNGWTIRAG